MLDSEVWSTLCLVFFALQLHINCILTECWETHEELEDNISYRRVRSQFMIEISESADANSILRFQAQPELEY